jgi:hypothetical protein
MLDDKAPPTDAPADVLAAKLTNEPTAAIAAQVVLQFVVKPK